MQNSTYRIFADIVLVTHVAFVSFVMFGLILILLGGFFGWSWIRNPWFRALHLCCIGLVVVQVWCGIVCPLTTLEMHFREMAGDLTYGGTFVAHWLHKLLFFQAPASVFVACYSLFGLAVVMSWILFRPRPFRQNPTEA